MTRTILFLATLSATAALAFSAGVWFTMPPEPGPAVARDSRWHCREVGK